MKKRLTQLADFAPTALDAWEKLSRIQKNISIAVISALILTLAALAPHERTTPLASDFFITLTQNPTHLSDADVTLYKSSFAAIMQGDYKAAADTMKDISNHRLIGVVLARQYLKPNYVATAEELTTWLAAYGDHPQAPQISRIALARGIKVTAIEAEKPLKGEGYAEHLGRTGMPDGWYRGLGLWREKNYSEAQPLFRSIGDNKDFSNWQRAAGYYWAYRAANKNEDRSAARDNLKQASHFKTTFYGLLAVQQTIGLEMDAKAPHVSADLRSDPRAIRAALFAQLGHTDEAEDELRHLYSAVDKRERSGIITLAHELNLANLQVRLANLSELSPEEELFASYPLPQYVIDAQTTQSPALLLAIARNESGFRTIASSGAGAVGLMQMLPSTAHTVERRVGRDALQVASTSDLKPIIERLNDPGTSVRYSAQYLSILAREPAVGKNLVRVLAAYNAGPGTVSGWQSMARGVDDPLLYIESIPYAETRNYVMQVMAHSWIYGSLLGENSQSLRDLAAGKWPGLAA
jgi:soluble lytic murein transglycosylase